MIEPSTSVFDCVCAGDDVPIYIRGGNMPNTDPRQQRLRDVLQAFGEKLQVLAKEEGVSESTLPIWKANHFMGAVGTQAAYMQFGVFGTGAELTFQDITAWSTQNLAKVAKHCATSCNKLSYKLTYAELYGFELPLSIFDEGSAWKDEAEKAATTYMAEGRSRSGCLAAVAFFGTLVLWISRFVAG